MIEGPSYAILGRGRWANIIRNVLVGAGRRTILIGETRRNAAETAVDYKSRLGSRMKASGSQIAWVCTPPGPHVPSIIEAAMDAGLHVVAEKPWNYSHRETKLLRGLALTKHLLIGVHHEYCLLDGVEAWRNRFERGDGLRFGGRFHLSRPDHLGMAAIDNLGSHLFAIREYAIPDATVAEIRCGYDLPDERCVWVEIPNEGTATIDFFGSTEPIIQRYAAKFEAAVDKNSFPFDLDFAARVAASMAAWKQTGENSRDS